MKNADLLNAHILILIFALIPITTFGQGNGRLVKSLSGEDWSLVSAPPLQGEKAGYHKDSYPTTEAIPARVPGDVTWDMMRAGRIPDIFIAKNITQAHSLARSEWWYQKKFRLSDEWSKKEIVLTFAGVDYAAKVWLNGHFLIYHLGQFTPFSLNVSDQIKTGQENTLTVLIEPGPQKVVDKIADCQYIWSMAADFTNLYKYWKNWNNCGVDCGAPLLSMGIWKDVTLAGSTDVHIEKLLVFPETSKPYETARLMVELEVESPDNREIVLEYRAECINAHAPDKSASQTALLLRNKNQVNFSFEIDSPALWWPNGYGNQNLYRLIVTAKDKKSGKILDGLSSKFGIRELKYLENPDAPDYGIYAHYFDKGGNNDKYAVEGVAYTFDGIKDVPKDQVPRFLTEINGRKIFLHGGNWVPADLIPVRADQRELEHFVRMAQIANYNCFRMWGGGIIEKEVFYDLCDEYGIMLIQEMPNFGIGPLEIPEEVTIKEMEQREIMPLLINHPCVIRYGYGNELYKYREISPLERLFEDICLEVDPTRLASGPDPVGEYQRHGMYTFNFTTDYELYGYTGLPLFNGPQNPVEWNEFGTTSVSSEETLNRIMPGHAYWPFKTDDKLMQWHNAFSQSGPTGWLYPEYYQALFGDLPDLKSEIRASQFAQFEGYRFQTQAQLRAKWHRSACFIWVFNESWPCAAVGSIVEYYGYPKMALYGMRNAFAQVNVSTRYKSMALHPGDTLGLPVFVNNSGTAVLKGCKLKTSIIDLKGKLYYSDNRDVNIMALMTQKIDSLRFKVPLEANHTVLLVRLELIDQKEKSLSSETYTFGVVDIPKDNENKEYLKPLLNAPKAKIKLSVASQNSLEWGSGEMSLYRASIKNTSKVPAIFVQLKSKYKPEQVYFKDNYLTLLPGEERKIVVLVSPEIKDSFTPSGISADAWNLN